MMSGSLGTDEVGKKGLKVKMQYLGTLLLSPLIKL